MHLMSYAEDNSNRGEDKAKAKGTLRKLREYKLVWYLHFMKDVLRELARLSLSFQSEDLNMSRTLTKLKSTVIALENLEREEDGQSLKEFYSELTDEANYKEHKLINVSKMDGVKEEVLPHLVDCLKSRFGNIYDDPLFNSLHIFDHKNWPENVELQENVDFGNNEIDILCIHFKDVLQHAGCDVEYVKSEWRDIKVHINRNIEIFRNMQPLYVWQRISLEDQSKQDYN